MDKIKVVWLCHFSNELVRSHLPLCSWCKKKLVDFAPWVTEMIRYFENFTDVELHVIAPHSGMYLPTCEFDVRGVNYHFFQSNKPFPLSIIDKLLCNGEKNDYKANRRYISKFIASIRPDLVNLIGSENPYYSIAALDIENIPIMLLCQTVYANPIRKKIQSHAVSRYRWNLELSLFQKIKYYACSGRMYFDLIKGYNPDAILFPLSFPTKAILNIVEVPKQYDFVWFAQNVTAKKGIDNAIEAMGILKGKGVECSLLVVGACDDNIKANLDARISQLGIESNVIFHGYFPSHNDMLQYIKQARFALLPCKIDVIAGTILEAMALSLPVVSFKTTGTPLINKKAESILLSDIDDNDGLANDMYRLLQDKMLGEKLIRNAHIWLDENKNSEKNTRRIVEQYYAILSHYKFGITIPQEMLFNVEDYPEYKS